MTTPATSRKPDMGARQPRDLVGWLALAASPTFALMAWIAATNAPGIALCAPAAAMPPIGGMAWMYLLMSLFHLSPWLNLAAGRTRAAPRN